MGIHRILVQNFIGVRVYFIIFYYFLRSYV